jgi:hypothetical protein
VEEPGAAVLAVALIAAAAASGKTATPVLSAHAIDGGRLGTTKSQAVKELTSRRSPWRRRAARSGRTALPRRGFPPDGTLVQIDEQDPELYS